MVGITKIWLTKYFVTTTKNLVMVTKYLISHELTKFLVIQANLSVYCDAISYQWPIQNAILSFDHSLFIDETEPLIFIDDADGAE